MRYEAMQKLDSHPKVLDAKWIETTYAVTLKPGWRHWELNGHVIMDNTIAGVRRQLRDVEICECDVCHPE